MKRTIDQVDVAGKRVLVRVDFNVPIEGGAVVDDLRLRRALPTLRSILDRGGSLVLMSHLGRPAGVGFEPELSLRPVAARLAALIDHEVFVPGDDPIVDAAELQGHDIVLLENLRFDPREKQGDAAFAASLASLGDIYCDDAFGTAHRSHASMVAVPQAMVGKPRAAGFLLATELAYFEDLLQHAEQPSVAVLGGAKVSDKMGVIANLLGRVDAILVGGAMAYSFLAAEGIGVGESLVERDRLDEAASMLASATSGTTEFLLPHDHVVGEKPVAGTPSQVVSDPIPTGWMGLDIGPETVKRYSEVLLEARTIIWNGPMGLCEIAPFGKGTRKIAEAVAEATRRGAVSVIGGGDTAAAVDAVGLAGDMTHISTGGGASLQVLEGAALPAVEALDE
jgi:phosphoglycerate kinase